MPRPVHVLCVDDEPKVLDGLSLSLRRRFRVSTASNGQAGLAIVDEDPPAVVISDMRMPEMNGAAFLSQVKERSPTSVRLLLTGHADLDSAIAAVNHGQVFRFLTKPCSAELFLAAVQAAAEQHRLITAEKELLEKTLRGTVEALTELLALAKPLAFGRAVRIKQHATELLAALGLPSSWPIEVAAMLSQIGCVAVPEQITESLYYGKPLTDRQVEVAKQLPAAAARLLRDIPRLDAVRAILEAEPCDFDGTGPDGGGPKGEAIPFDARVLRLVSDYDFAEAAQRTPLGAIAALQAHSGHYDPTLLRAFASLKARVVDKVRYQLRLGSLRAGMSLAEDVTSTTDVLLVPRGQQVTPSLLHRLRNLAVGTVREPIAVFVPTAAPQSKNSEEHQ